MAEPTAPSFPWLYRYEEDGPRLGSVVLRPVVDVSFVGATDASPPVRALVDTGCGHVLAAPWIARAVEVAPSSKPTWPALVGQVGFLDQFTVTFSHLAKHLAIEPVGQFDERYGVPLAR